MSNANDLYKRAIFDHNRNPRNFRVIEDASHVCDGFNPLCGDKINVFVKMSDADTIEDISFMGSGCAIFKASASFMTSHVKGKSRKETEGVISMFLDMVKGETQTESLNADLGKLTIFQGIREFPARVKCATLAWHTLSCAMEKKRENDIVTNQESNQ